MASGREARLRGLEIEPVADNRGLWECSDGADVSVGAVVADVAAIAVLRERLAGVDAAAGVTVADSAELAVLRERLGGAGGGIVADFAAMGALRDLP